MTILQILKEYRDMIIFGLVGVVLLVLLGNVFINPAPVLKEPFFGGVFNMLFLGIPVYGFLLPFAVVVIIGSEFLMYWFYWRPFDYMLGIYRAYWDKINACFIGDLSNRYELVPENKAKLIHTHEEYMEMYDDFFADADPLTKASVWLGRKFGRNYDMVIAKKLEPDIHEAPAVHAGGIPIDIILDLAGVTFPPDKSLARKECIRATDAWNMLHPEDEIFTYYKFFRKYDEIDRQVQIDKTVLPKTVKIPIARVKAAFPPEENEAWYSGYERQLAEQLGEQESVDLRNYTLYIIGFFVLINIIMWGARAVHLVGHH
jgi:hypothetical protein